MLKLLGASAVAATVPVVHAEDGWRVAETPVDSTLRDVKYTATTPHAAGNGGGLGGRPPGRPDRKRQRPLRDRRHRRRRAPLGRRRQRRDRRVRRGDGRSRRPIGAERTENFNDVAVTGPAGDADVYVADDSGAIHYSFENGEEGTWESAVPGSGDALPAIDFHAERAGHVIAEGGRVYATDDGTSWNAIGIEDADASL